MPYEVKKVGDKWKLWKINEKVFTKSQYNSKESAIAAGKNFMRYNHEKPYVKGNKILAK